MEYIALLLLSLSCMIPNILGGVTTVNVSTTYQEPNGINFAGQVIVRGYGNGSLSDSKQCAELHSLEIEDMRLGHKFLYTGFGQYNTWSLIETRQVGSSMEFTLSFMMSVGKYRLYFTRLCDKGNGDVTYFDHTPYNLTVYSHNSADKEYGYFGKIWREIDYIKEHHNRTSNVLARDIEPFISVIEVQGYTLPDILTWSAICISTLTFIVAIYNRF